MGYSDIIFHAAAEILHEAEELSDAISLRQFHELISAMSCDSRLPRNEVRALLIEELLSVSDPQVSKGNVIWLEKLMNQWT